MKPSEGVGAGARRPLWPRPLPVSVWLCGCSSVPVSSSPPPSSVLQPLRLARQPTSELVVIYNSKLFFFLRKICSMFSVLPPATRFFEL